LKLEAGMRKSEKRKMERFEVEKPATRNQQLGPAGTEDCIFVVSVRSVFF